MPDLKLFVCSHTAAPVPKHPLLYPVQAGAALAGEHFPGYLADDTGPNISAKNRDYSELTAQYWAWKNVPAEHYGFFHYRRYMYPDPNARLPYMVARKPELSFLKRLGFDGFADLVAPYDLIAPIGEDMHISVREHYARAPQQQAGDLALMEQIVRERYPEMAAAIDRHLSGTICYFGNIYIMRRDVFDSYCTWLFPLLAEYDTRAAARAGYVPERRVDGYLSERLFGIYLAHYSKELKTLELPRVLFYGDGAPYIKRKLQNTLLPPGSKRRSIVKNAMAPRKPERKD